MQRPRGLAETAVVLWSAVGWGAGLRAWRPQRSGQPPPLCGQGLVALSPLSDLIAFIKSDVTVFSFSLPGKCNLKLVRITLYSLESNCFSEK